MLSGRIHRHDEGADDGKMIPPTNKKFHIEFCTVATWNNGEERLNYDLMGLLKQIGVM